MNVNTSFCFPLQFHKVVCRRIRRPAVGSVDLEHATWKQHDLEHALKHSDCIQMSGIAYEDAAEESLAPTFESLANDAALQILVFLDPLDLCYVMRTSKTIWAMVRDAHVWNALYLSRTAPRSSMRYSACSFTTMWVNEMTLLDEQELAGLDQAGASIVQPQEVGLSTSSAAPIVWGSSARKMPEARGVDPERFRWAVQGLLRRKPHPCFLVEWLRTREAERRPVGCLAVLAALQDGAAQEWGLPAHECASTADAPAAVLVQSDASARQTAREKLLSSPWSPPPSLLNQVVLRWSTWSQLRDCRGFRARDDKHRRAASLLELCQQPDAEVWTVVARGEGNDVRELRLSAQ